MAAEYLYAFLFISILNMYRTDYNWGTNMSINGDWMNITPAAKSPTWRTTVNAGVFLSCWKVDSCLGAMVDVEEKASERI